MPGGSVLKASKRMYAPFFDSSPDSSSSLVDDAHKARMKFLQKEMANARDTLDKLHTRAYELYISIIPSAREIAKSADARSPSPYPRASRRTEDLIAAAGSDSRLFEVLQVEGRTLARVPETGNEDLIEILLAE